MDTNISLAMTFVILTAGIDLIYRHAMRLLERYQITPMEVEGKPFDPNLHQAVDRVESEEAEDMAILSEYQRGYNFKGKLLRPAMVTVAVRP